MYISSEAGNDKTVVARIKPEQDLFKAISKILDEHDIKCGYIPVLQGCLKKGRILTVKNNPECAVDPLSQEQDIDEPMVFSGNGTIARDDEGNPFIHIHPTVATEDGRILMGHLISGIVCLTMEVVIVSLSGIEMGRKQDPDVNNQVTLALKEY